MKSTAVCILINRLIIIIALIYAIGVSLYIYWRTPGLKSQYRIFNIWKYFSIWTATLHLVFYLVCIISDAVPFLKATLEKSSLRGTIYYALIFPTGLLVFTFYWGFIFSRKSWFHSREVHLMPTHAFVNHILHSLPILTLLVEGALALYPLPRRVRGLAALLALMMSYWILLITLGFWRRYWVYPILQRAYLPVKFIIMLLVTLIITGFYFLGEVFHKLIGRRKSRSKKVSLYVRPEKRKVAASESVTSKRASEDIEATV